MKKNSTYVKIVAGILAALMLVSALSIVIIYFLH